MTTAKTNDAAITNSVTISASLKYIWKSFVNGLFTWKHYKNAIYLKLLIKFLVRAQRKRCNLVVLRCRQFYNLTKKLYLQASEVTKLLKLNVSADSTLSLSIQKSSFRTPPLCRQQKLALTLTYILLYAFPSSSPSSTSRLVKTHSYFRMLWTRKWTYTKPVIINLSPVSCSIKDL